jgi:hypothetical protein
MCSQRFANHFLRYAVRRICGGDMRIAPLFMFLGTAIGLGPVRYDQGPKPARNPEASFSIVIRASQDVVKIGSPISVEVTKTNQSNHVINNSKVRSVSPPYEIDIKDDQGNSRPETESFRQAKKSREADLSHSFSVAYGNLKPGESDRDRIDLNGYYDVGLSGTYTIQLHQFDSETKKIVKSNTITVTVTPS